MLNGRERCGKKRKEKAEMEGDCETKGERCVIA